MRKASVRIVLALCCVVVAALSASAVRGQQRIIPDEPPADDGHDSQRTTGDFEPPMYLFTDSSLDNGARCFFTTVVWQFGSETDITSLRFAPSVVVLADVSQLPSTASITLTYSPCGLTNGDAPTVDFLADNRFVCTAQASKPTCQEGGGCMPARDSDNTVLVITYADFAHLARASLLELRLNGRGIELSQEARKSLRLITNAVADSRTILVTPPN